MNLIVRNLNLALILALSAFLLACGSGNSSSNATSSNPPLNAGILPNGSNVVVNQSTFTLGSESTSNGNVRLVGGLPQVSYTLTFSVNPVGPIVSPNPTTCILVSGLTSDNACNITFSSLAASAGTYKVTISYQVTGSEISARTPLPNPITFVISSKPEPGPTSPPLTIFIADEEANGNLGATWESIDSHCMSSNNKPIGNTSQFKAMLVGSKNGIIRRACITPDCTDPAQNSNWVLAPNTAYTWSNGNILFTTNSAGIFPFGRRNDFPPPSEIMSTWTGLTPKWETSNFTCNNWTSGSKKVEGKAGEPGTQTAGFISAPTLACDSSMSGLYCIEQPKLP